jgi:alpha-L-rhamnosidase
MKITFLFCVLLFGTGCIRHIPDDGSENIGLTGQSKWIRAAGPGSSTDESMFGNHPAPLFRKEFRVGENRIRKATLYITAAGYYKATLNGNRIGDIYLDPAWTNFDKRIYFSEYDLTPELQAGNNCLGVALGNGFYNPLPMKMWGYLNLREFLPVGIPAFTARLLIEYRNGIKSEICTDSTWRYAPGPLLRNNVYLGEWADARCEIPGWDLPGFDDRNWNYASLADPPGGILMPRFFPPVRITGIFPAVKIATPAKDIHVANLGSVITGIYKVRLKGNPGDTVRLRFGERVYDDGMLNPMTTVCGQIKSKGKGGAGAPDTAWQADTYVLGTDTDVWYSPEFTSHAFRYIEISGLKYKPLPSDITALALNSDVEESGHFECSSPLLNAIQKMAARTFRSNLIGGVQSDCPARERFGYGGDINAVSDAFIFNFDMHGFYRKTIYDWLDIINDSVFVDTAPYVGLQYCGISYESVFLLLQHQLYLYYHDRDIVRELYMYDKKWMEKVQRLLPGLIANKGIGDHEALIPASAGVTGTSHYLHCAAVMKEFATFMDDTAGFRKYSVLESALKKKFLEHYWFSRDSIPADLNKQTILAALLYTNSVPDNMKDAVIDSLVSSVQGGINGHFMTGIFGTKYILDALSSNGMTQMVFDIVNSPDYPGWGYMISRGATTIWETWKESDNIYSNCHPMFGSISGWFFRWIGGIRPDREHPGFSRFCLEPHLPEGLSFARTSYKCPYGTIRSDWERSTDGTTEFILAVPEKTRAMFKVTAGEGMMVKIRRNSKNLAVSASDFENGFFRRELKPGNYIIRFQKGLTKGE